MDRTDGPARNLHNLSEQAKDIMEIIAVTESGNHDWGLGTRIGDFLVWRAGSWEQAFARRGHQRWFNPKSEI